MRPEVIRTYSGEVMVCGLTESRADELAAVLSAWLASADVAPRWIEDIAAGLRDTHELTRSAIERARAESYELRPFMTDVGRDHPALNEPRG